MPKTEAPLLPVPVVGTDDNITVSFSELDTYRQCPLKHFIAYKQRWQKPADAGTPLYRGSLWHMVMEAHYLSLWEDQKAGKPRSLARASLAVEQFLFDDKGNQTEDQELVQWMYDGYVEQYGADEQWIILGVEYKLAEFLPDHSGNLSEFIIKGKLDLIVQEVKNGKVWVVDHKSGGNLPGQFELDIDDQFGIYTWLMQRRGLKILGAIHSAARTTRNQADFPGYVGKSKPQELDQRFKRVLMNRSKPELENLIRDAFAVAVNAYPPEGMELPLYSSPDPRQCGWKCDYKEIHIIARKGRPLPTLLAEYGFEQNFTRH